MKRVCFRLTFTRPSQQMAQNAHAYAVGEAGWILWYDWYQEVQPGADYGGTLKPVQISGLSSPSVQVTTLWPESIGNSLDDEGRVTATWTSELVAVEDGVATVSVGEDPVSPRLS